MLVLLLVSACGPAVGATGDGTDGASSGATAPGDSSDGDPSDASSTGDTPLACAPPLQGAPVSRAEVASSLAAVLCIAQEDCCPNARPSPSCRHALNMTFEDLDADAETLGLAYDDDCVGLHHALVEALGCQVAPPTALTGFATCSIYYGTGARGEACESVGTLGSTCQQGLVCSAGSCEDGCSLESSGRPYVYGHACEIGQVVVGHACEQGVPLGSACGGNCAEGLYCGDMQTCEAASPIGEPCRDDAECRDSVCIDEVCALGQPEGESCDPGCGLGLACDPETDRCVALPYVCGG